MKKLMAILAFSLIFTACASKSKHNSDGLEKYPQCYHQNPKLSNKCIEKNEAGTPTTALQLENSAYPGQYK